VTIQAQFLSTADAARVLGLTASAVRLMVRRGELPVAARTEGGIQLLRRPDLEALAAKRAKARASRGR
jgi:excisionase family DNA binding protein